MMHGHTYIKFDLRIVSNMRQDKYRSSDLFRGKTKRVLSFVQVVLKYGTRF